jgi:WD40 repeat protein
VKVWDLSTQTAVDLTWLSKSAYAVGFSPEGRFLVAAGGGQPRKEEEGEVKVYHATTGTVAHDLRGHSATVYDAAISPCGNRLATASADGTVKIWDLPTGQELLTLPCPGAVGRIAFSPDGLRLAARTLEGDVLLWDARPTADIAQ